MIDLIANGAQVAENPQLSANNPQPVNRSVMPFPANPQNPHRGERSVSPQIAENPQLSANNPQPVNRSVMPFPANPQNPHRGERSVSPQPEPEPAKARNERYRPHLNPEWVAARDEWHRHYFKCKICQGYHRNHRHRPPQNPCDTGRLLHELYRLASQ